MLHPFCLLMYAAHDLLQCNLYHLIFSKVLFWFPLNAVADLRFQDVLACPRPSGRGISDVVRFQQIYLRDQSLIVNLEKIVMIRIVDYGTQHQDPLIYVQKVIIVKTH